MAVAARLAVQRRRDEVAPVPERDPSRAHQNVKVGDDLFTTEVPGLAAGRAPIGFGPHLRIGPSDHWRPRSAAPV